MMDINIKKYAEMLEKIQPKYVGAVFPIEECPVPLIGDDIKRHLRGAKSALICAATLGSEFDRLLRQLQVTDMTGAVILDSISGDYLEDFIDRESGNARRFSPGYGDFPLSVSRDIIAVLNAPKKIGLCMTEDCILTPLKSITGVSVYDI